MKKHDFYLIIFAIVYALAYYYFIRHLNIPKIVFSIIPLIIAVIILSLKAKSSSKALKSYYASKEKKKNELK